MQQTWQTWRILLCITCTRHHNSNAVLLAIFPFSRMLSTIGPGEGANPAFFVSLVLTLIFSAVGPQHHPIPVKLIMPPLPQVYPIIRPTINAHAMERIVFKIASISRTILPSKDAFAVFQPLPGAIKQSKEQNRKAAPKHKQSSDIGIEDRNR